MEILTKSEKETKNLGKEIGKKILKIKKGPIILCLVGDLGGGKTTFLKGFAQGLGIKEKILSPTFVLMRRFQIKNTKFENFYHFDCYRIQKRSEILKLNFKEILKNKKNITAIEWAEKIKRFIPKKAIWISFKILKKREREIKIYGGKKILNLRH